MYVYYKDKNDTIGFVELKGREPYKFEKPVFVFHFELSETEQEKAQNENETLKLNGLNPYERAYTSDKLNYEFEIQEHMFTLKTIYWVVVEVENKNHKK